MMGYLSVVFNKYYNSNNRTEKINIKSEFLNRIWNSSVPYEKYEKTFNFRIIDDKIDDEDVLNAFRKYNKVPYKILKSRFNINTLEKEDLIKLRINSNYGKYFDKDVYIDKEYYRQMYKIKNLYFLYIEDNCEIDVINEIEYIHSKAENIKLKSQEKKIDMSWENYKGFINSCFDKIFENYIPLDNKIESGEFYPNKFSDWDEDNYIVGYVNKSLNGYVKNYYNETRSNKIYKYCKKCGRMIRIKGKNSKYCDDCSYKRKLEKYKKYNKKR